MSNTTNGIPERIYIKTKTTDMRQKHNRIRKQERDKNVKTQKIEGVLRESNSRPLAPEARIIPLDQTPSFDLYLYPILIIVFVMPSLLGNMHV